MESECLKAAIENRDVDKLNSFLSNYSAQYINTFYFEGIPPLLFAINCAYNGQQVSSKQPVSCGNNNNNNNKHLHSISQNNKKSSLYRGEEIILRLIDAGVDVNATCYMMETPLMSALEAKSSKDILERLIDAGSDVNACCSDNKIPLIYAIEYNHSKEIIRELIKRGSNVNQCCVDGWTPLIYEMEYNKDPEVISMLTNAGANVNVLDFDKQSLLMKILHNYEYCADEYCYYKKIIDILVSHGIDIKYIDFKGKSILHKTDCKYLMELAVRHGVCVNLLTYKGMTALKIATYNCDLAKVTKLLSLGANPNCVDLDLETPLHSVLDDDIITLLLYYGASLNALNARKQTPVDVLLDPNSYDPQFIKSGVRAILKHFLLFISGHGYREDNYLLKLDDYVKKHLYSFKNKCRKELCRMRKRFISNNLTFYQFCNLKLLHSSDIVDIPVKEYNYNYTRIKNLFPLYQNVIIMRLKDNHIKKFNLSLRKNLERIAIRPLSCDKADSAVTLDYDCLYDICRFLSRKQIYNLFLSSI